MAEKEKVLSVKDLVVHFSTDHGYVQAVRGISFDLYKGETLCIVGESGSGKSVTSKSIMGILAANGRIKNGSIMYEGEDLTKISEDEFHRIRGNKIGMIFQDPLSSLNPIVRIGKQITEAMLINGNRLKKIYQDKVANELIAYKNAQTALKSGISNAKDRINFLKVDKKKVSENYGVKHNLAEAKLYKCEQDYLASHSHLMNLRHEELNKLKEEYDETLKILTNDGADKSVYFEKTNAYKQAVNEVKTSYKGKADQLHADFLKYRAPMKADLRKEKRDNKNAVKEIKIKFDKEIKVAISDYKKIKKELREQYKPVIKETKIAYNARAKVAKKEVREYKASLIGQYRADRRGILINLKNTTTDRAKAKALEDLKVLREDYISKLKVTKKEAKARALKIMKEVGISYPEKRYRQYPFEFSGGMRQRIVIAIALTADPDILICDEPTTALDVTIQAQILELINNLKKSRNLSCIFITHDLGVVANMADRVAVMYAGKIIESGTADEIFYDPRHPYTWALLSSIPDVDSKERLEAIPGTPPNMIYPPVGDAFALRSKYALAVDFKKEPPMFKITDTHYASTWLLDPRAPKVEMPLIVKTRIKNAMAKRKLKEAK